MNEIAMKTLAQLKNQEPVYLNGWKSRIDVISDFEDVYLSGEECHAIEAPYSNVALWVEKKQKMQELIGLYSSRHILFASYGHENHSGDAFVLFEEGGKLFEVNGSHCSCYGLEDQWKPEETTLEAIRFRLEKGQLGKDDYSGNKFSAELFAFLGIEQVVDI